MRTNNRIHRRNRVSFSPYIFAILILCVSCSAARAELVCEMVLDPADNLKARVTFSGSATNTGSTAFGSYAAAITKGTDTIFNAPNGVELIAGRTVGTIPVGALTLSYGGNTHSVKEIIFRATQDDLWFDVRTGVTWGSGAAVSAGGSFTATFAAGPNGETLDDVEPGTYVVNLASSNNEGNIPFILKILTPIMVTNTLNSGVGSLRDAIDDVVDGENIITFDPGLNGQTIRLTGGQLTIGKSVAIDASALPDGITISGDIDNNGTPNVRAFEILEGIIVSLDTLTIIQCKAFNSSYSGGNGGGIYSEGHLTVRNSNLFDNVAGDAVLTAGALSIGGSGGGICNRNGTLYVYNSTISGNVAGDAAGGDISEGGHGGGIYSNAGNAYIYNSTLTGNRCGDSFGGQNFPGISRGGNGGGIYSGYTGGFHLYNCTITGNETGFANEAALNEVSHGQGGGIFSYNGQAGSVRSSIVVENSADDVYGDSALFISGGNNLIGNNANVGAQFPAGLPNGNDDYVGTSGSPIEAILGSLGDNGGPTRTRMPLRGSLALEHGTFTGEASSRDQRGVARPIGGGVDIGAVEAPDYAALDAAAALRARLLSQIRKFKAKHKSAQRRKQVTKVKKFKNKVRKLKVQLQRI